jgi:tetratricopeptide (TPR) repeat protein
VYAASRSLRTAKYPDFRANGSIYGIYLRFHEGCFWRMYNFKCMKSGVYIAILLSPILLTAQNRYSGAIQKINPILHDTAAIDRYNAKVAHFIFEREMEDSAVYYDNAAYSASVNTQYLHGLAISFLYKSFIAEHFHNDFAEAKKNAEKAMALIQQTGNKGNLVDIIGQVAYTNYVTGNYTRALETAETSVELAKEMHNDAALNDALGLSAAIQIKKGEFQKGFENTTQGFEIAVKSKDSFSVKESYIQFGELCMALEDYQLALQYYRMAYANFTREDLLLQKKNEVDVWSQMEFAEIYGHLNMFDSALQRYNLFDTLHAPEKDLRVFLGSKGEYYMLIHEYEKALPMLLRALDIIQRENDENERMRTLLDVAGTYHALHDDRKALDFAYQGLNLALLIDNRQFIRDGYKLLYNIYDSEGKNDSAYNYYRSYIKAKESLAADQTKGKLATYDYEQKLRIQEQHLKNETLLRNILIIFAFAILIVSFLLLRNIRLKRKNENLTNENTRKELEYKTAEMEMQALRAQMNPHFIFNCLNSINRFIMKNESEIASDYLTQFSRLIRLVLNNSKKAWISLEDEIEMLRLYLEMERLRFKDAFQYEIHCDDNIDPIAIMIPPLLLQPFVENAVWHGLMHKKENGTVTVSFSEANNILHCTVIDNGVGRSVAATAGSKSSQAHKSMGIQITRDRLALINGDIRDEKVAFEIEDRFDSKGQPAGTKVSLKIKFRPFRELAD